jgi:MoaA/NifB/PqqE/SkfB family radical SAM enzyme
LLGQIFDQAKQLGVQDIAITGGEPLLHADFFQILKSLRGHNFRLALFTNGTLLNDRHLSALRRVNIRFVQISLYAINPCVHDKMTGLKGSHAKTIDTIQQCIGANIPVFVSVPVCKINMEDALNVIEWANTRQIPNAPNFSISRGIGEKKSNIVLRLTPEDLDEMDRNIRERHPTLNYVWGSPMGNGAEFDPYGILRSSLGIGADGHAYPMIAWRCSLGDLRIKSLREIWLHDRYLNQLKQVVGSDLPGCCGCEAISTCTFCPTDHVNENGGVHLGLSPAICALTRKQHELALRWDHDTH